MINNGINEGVGKRIVDALKLQTEEAVQDTFTSSDIVTSPQVEYETNLYEETPVEHYSAPISFASQEVFAKDLEDFEVPTNVAVLKQLINQLPAGVSRQTGAQIIKQTMEALGISMKSVLQEAQQVQENLNNSSRQCQATISDYKQKIAALEKQGQKYQRQYAALNDIISLFVQTSI